MPIKRTFDLTKVLNALAKQRPMFHSEADFQHALAWAIQKHHPKMKVRLEYRPNKINNKTYVDIWLEDDNRRYAIELKYKTRNLKTKINSESYNLLAQSAQDIARYDYCRDIKRIETLASTYSKLTGYAVLLTNDPGYWKQSNRNTIDKKFRVHDGAILKGRLQWAKHAAAGTTKDREKSILLKATHQVKWMEYSNCGNEKYSQFRMVIIKTR